MQVSLDILANEAPKVNLVEPVKALLHAIYRDVVPHHAHMAP